MPHSVLLVEDDEPTRTRLAQAIESQPDLRLLAAVGTCAEARGWLAQAPLDVLLVDLGLPDGRGADLIRETSRRQPAALSMVITGFGDEAHVIEAITAGACAYLLKDASSREIGCAILEMVAGGSPISPAVARYVLDHFRGRPQAGAAMPAAPDFSERETTVLQLMAKGYAYGEIGERLDISVNTVREYVRHVYRKLAVGSRGEAVFEAQSLGLIGVSHAPLGRY